MEDTLRDLGHYGKVQSYQVLILVLMEDTLRDEDVPGLIDKIKRLNPCFNGRYSQRYSRCRR